MDKQQVLVDKVVDAIRRIGRWRGELKLSVDTIQYYGPDLPERIDLLGHQHDITINSAGELGAPAGITNPPLLFSIGLDGLDFAKVAHAIQTRIVKEIGLNAAPSVSCPIEVVQHEAGGIRSSFMFENYERMDEHLHQDPFGDWRWRRTGRLLDNRYGAAFIDNTNNRASYVCFGAVKTAEEFRRNYQLDPQTIPAPVELPPLPEPVLIKLTEEHTTTADQLTQLYGANSEGITADLLKLRQERKEKTVIEQTIPSVVQGITGIGAQTNDGLTINGSGTQSGVFIIGGVDGQVLVSTANGVEWRDQAQTSAAAEQAPEPEKTSWALPAVCLAALGAAGVLAARGSKAAKVAKQVGQQVVQKESAVCA